MATISATTKFNLTSTPKQFSWTDTTDWAGQFISVNDVNGCFRVVSPSGVVIYNNTDFSNSNCDIWIGNDLISQQVVPLPLNGDGTIEAGEYQVLYTVYNSDTDEYYTQSYTFTYDYVPATICIQNAVDCITPRFTATDATVYVVNGITPTLTRVMKLFYPPGNADGATYTSTSSSVLMTGTFYQGVQTTTIVSAVNYTFSDGLIVQDSLSGSMPTLVDCTFICDIYCCIKSYETTMLSFQGVNDTKYVEYSNTFQQIMAFAGLAKLAIQCGKPNDVNAYLTQIQSLSQCTSSCSCSGETPSRVTGLGGITVQTVVEGSAPVVVTSSTSGSVTTYTVSLTDAFINLVNSRYNTTVSGGYGISVVGTGTDPVNYEVSASLVSTRTESTQNFAVSAAEGQDVTGCTVTVPTTGTYMIWFEADWKGSQSASDLTYRLRKNGLSTLGTDRKEIAPASGQVKVVIVQTNVSLAAADTIAPQVDSTTGGTLVGRSITILRIA